MLRRPSSCQPRRFTEFQPAKFVKSRRLRKKFSSRGGILAILSPLFQQAVPFATPPTTLALEEAVSAIANPTIGRDATTYLWPDIHIQTESEMQLR